MSVDYRKTSEKKKIAFIIGAGVSKAIAPKEIPAMNDFFDIISIFAKQDKNIKITLNSLERYGLLLNKEVNLEYVLEHTTKLPRNHDNPWERPYDGLLLTLHKIRIFEEFCLDKIFFLATKNPSSSQYILFLSTRNPSGTFRTLA